MKISNILYIELLFQTTWCALGGGNLISFHKYHELPPHEVRTFCEIPTAELDINRITAVQGLNIHECGACLQVEANDKVIHVLAVDAGGAGLDLSEGAFSILSHPSVGRLPAGWHQVDSSLCMGIYRGSKTTGFLKDYVR